MKGLSNAGRTEQLGGRITDSADLRQWVEGTLHEHAKDFDVEAIMEECFTSVTDNEGGWEILTSFRYVWQIDPEKFWDVVARHDKEMKGASIPPVVHLGDYFGSFPTFKVVDIEGSEVKVQRLKTVTVPGQGGGLAMLYHPRVDHLKGDERWCSVFYEGRYPQPHIAIEGVKYMHETPAYVDTLRVPKNLEELAIAD